MYAGKIVEYGPVDDVLDRPLHPYTQGLLRSIPGENLAEKGQPLHQIPGSMPSLLSLPPAAPSRPAAHTPGRNVRLRPTCALKESAPSAAFFRLSMTAPLEAENEHTFS